eukprot:PhF_6_TR40412/c0_g1_i1/m.60231
MSCKEFIQGKFAGRCKACGMPPAAHETPTAQKKPNTTHPDDDNDDSSGGIQTFTHEQFIAAQMMMGKECRVTATTIKAELDKKARVDAAGREAQQCVVGGEGGSKGRSWEAMHEAEEIKQEHEVRMKIKQQAALQQEEQTKSVEVVVPPVTTVPAQQEEQQKEEAIPQAVPPQEVKPSAPTEPKKAEDDKESKSPPAPIINAEDKHSNQVPTQSPFHGSGDHYLVSLHWIGLIDLDISCIALTKSGDLKYVFYAGASDPTHGLLYHSGDKLRAPPPNGASETIMVDFPHLEPSIECLYFTVSSFTPSTLRDAKEITVTVRYGSSRGIRNVIAVYPILAQGHVGAEEERLESSGVVACRIRRSNDGAHSWVVEDCRKDIVGRILTARELVRPVQAHYDV